MRSSKPSRSGEHGTASTGWEKFLEAVILSGFSISGTWPVRTELTSNAEEADECVGVKSIVLVCRKRPEDAPLATRRQFIDALKAELPTALAHLQSGGIAPVDLAQAAIGPGMAVYTRYAKVVDAAGEPVTVREALTLINQTLDECLSAQEGDFDADTRWALAWFEQHGFEDGELRRRGDALQSEEHQHRLVCRPSASCNPRPARCGCSSPSPCGRIGTRARREEYRSGSRCTT